MMELKPCPFCGGKAKLKVITTDAIAMMPNFYWHRVSCMKCGATVEATDSLTAIEAWNRRTNENQTE